MYWLLQVKAKSESNKKKVKYQEYNIYDNCRRSVSYATPAYYAHWAARRGKLLLSAKNQIRESDQRGENDFLKDISERWAATGKYRMFFI